MFIYFWERERERERASRRRAEREGDTESEAGSELSAQPDAGLESMNHEIMTWAKVGCLTEWATQAPLDSAISFLDVYPFVLIYLLKILTLPPLKWDATVTRNQIPVCLWVCFWSFYASLGMSGYCGHSHTIFTFEAQQYVWSGGFPSHCASFL